MALRRALGPLAAGWLFCQVATLTLASAVFWADTDQRACTCAHGANSTCPMHHHGTVDGSKICALGAANDGLTEAVRSLFGPIGLVPIATHVVDATTTGTLTVAEPAMTTLRPIPPDPPPPRA